MLSPPINSCLLQRSDGPPFLHAVGCWGQEAGHKGCGEAMATVNLSCQSAIWPSGTHARAGPYWPWLPVAVEFTCELFWRLLPVKTFSITFPHHCVNTWRLTDEGWGPHVPLAQCAASHHCFFALWTAGLLRGRAPRSQGFHWRWALLVIWWMPLSTRRDARIKAVLFSFYIYWFSMYCLRSGRGSASQAEGKGGVNWRGQRWTPAQEGEQYRWQCKKAKKDF